MKKTQENAYYLLTSYGHYYHNGVSRLIFHTKDATARYENEAHAIAYYGFVNLDNIHIQEITITGSAKAGFTVHITPESEESFTIASEASS